MSDIIVTNEVRLSYVNVFTPSAKNDKYQVTVLLPKSDLATKQKIDFAIEQARQEAPLKGIQLPNPPKTPIHDGDGSKVGGGVYGDECKGCWVFTASSKNKPDVVDANVQPILSQTDVYSGCYGRVSLRFYPYDSGNNKGIACGLGNVQKLRDGEPLGGGTSAKQDFGAPTQPMQNTQQYAPQPYAQPVQSAQSAQQSNSGYGFLGL